MDRKRSLETEEKDEFYQVQKPLRHSNVLYGFNPFINQERIYPSYSVSPLYPNLDMFQMHPPPPQLPNYHQMDTHSNNSSQIPPLSTPRSIPRNNLSQMPPLSTPRSIPRNNVSQMPPLSTPRSIPRNYTQIHEESLPVPRRNRMFRSVYTSIYDLEPEEFDKFMTMKVRLFELKEQLKEGKILFETNNCENVNFSMFSRLEKLYYVNGIPMNLKGQTYKFYSSDGRYKKLFLPFSKIIS